MHHVATMNSPHEDHNHRRRKSYLNERTRRSSDKQERKASVTDSLTQYLAHAQDEDLIFNACSSPAKTRRQTLSSCSDHGTPKQYKGGNGSFGTLSRSSDHISKSIENLPISPHHNYVDRAADEQTRQLPFDRRTLRKSKSTKGKRSSKKQPTTKPAPAAGREPDDSDSDDMQSFAVDNDEDVSISSGEGRSHRSNTRSVSARPTRGEQPLRRAKSFQNKDSNSAQTSSAPHYPHPPRRTQSARGPSGTRRNGSGPASIGDLERHSRRQRMKQAYRGTPLPGVHRMPSNKNSSLGDETDGGESVASGTSMYSTNSTRSYRRSGLEGGALNAYLADERFARNAGKGLCRVPSSGSVMQERADEAFIDERKARQDLIMDVAIKEKWKYQARADRDAHVQDRQQSAFDGSDNDFSSDEDGLKYKKKRGVVGNLRRAVRKTAKTSKSAAKGTVNVVKDPKRAAKKVGGFAKEVGKETAKMVLDPTLAAKRGKNGIKGTVNLTTKVTGTMAKGGLDLTTSLAKNSLNVTTMVVGTTIDGAGKVVHGAAGFLKKDKDDGGIEYDDYDPRVLLSRQRIGSLIHKFIPSEDHDKADKIDGEDYTDVVDTSLQRRNNGARNDVRNTAMSTILVPPIDAGGGSGSWDL